MFEYNIQNDIVKIHINSNTGLTKKPVILVAPPSKSVSIRAVFGGLLSSEGIILRKLSTCSDVLSTLNVVNTLGNNVDLLSKEDESIDIQITKVSRKQDVNIVNCGESGLCARMIVPVLGLIGQPQKAKTVTGEGSLLNRPFDMLGQLRQFGLAVNTTNGKLPVIVQGELKSNKGYIDTSITSQVLSGLLMTLPLVSGNSEISVENPLSKPYILLTLDVMSRFGVHVLHDEALKHFEIPGEQSYVLSEFQIEGDWSAGAFLLVLAILLKKEGINVSVSNLSINSVQADKAILDVLKDVGVLVNYSHLGFTVDSIDELKPFEFNAEDCPDLVPPLVCLATFCEGESKIYGVGRLQYKESNRLEALGKLLNDFGIKCCIENNVFIVVGSTTRFTTDSVLVDSYKDHRIAMAGSILAFGKKIRTIIKDGSCVSKSFPGFYKQLMNIVR
ncbi:MAG: 3-phosphoshikimate 1-carboxyvinyltransferase [Fervidobacterium sp.]|nr:3-phosphoshikimate 1-carboxyvinyltransferase [Fervidobacterium sp.]